MTLPEAEFTVLRQTIARRGTARMILVPVTLIGWGALALIILLFTDYPIAWLIPLTVLAGGFEAIHALHVGVERIGRYLQVNYESPDGPHWESTVTRVGPALPGGGIDPLFAFVFAGATFINIIPTLSPALGPFPVPTRIELGVIAALHFLFIVRIVRARGAAARQRAVELESFKAVREQKISNP